MADEQGKRRSSGRETDSEPQGPADEPGSAPAENPDPARTQPPGAAEGAEAPGESKSVPPEEPATEVEEGATDDDETDGRRVTLTRRRLNRVSLGTLTVHYQTRSVKFSLDGDSAMRLLAVLVGHRHDGTLDVIDPDNASAFRGWVMVDSAEVIGADWDPLPEPSRVAVDPPSKGGLAGLRRLLYEGRVSEQDVLDLPFVPSWCASR